MDEKRFTFQDLIEKIDANNGPEGVDFSSYNFSDIDLHYKTIRKQIPPENLTQVTWYSSSTHGINLRGTRFQNANLNNANLEQADFSEATLYGANLKKAKCHDSRFSGSYLIKVQAQEADFSYCDMNGSYLIEANLSGANLANTKLQGVDLSSSILDNANLSGAKLTEVDLDKASLTGINLYNTWIVGTYLTRHQIGESIIQESRDWVSPVQGMPGNYAQATSIYRALKNNFLSIGSYQDASWAYIKERRNRKHTHWPPSQVRANHPDEFSQLTDGKWHLFKFYLKHFSAWLLDWIFELSSSYGEKPSLTVIWALAFIFSFAALFKFSGEIEGAKTWIDYFNYSLGSFVTVGFNQFEAQTPLTQTLTSIEALLGICILALMMFALGNRINRS